MNIKLDISNFLSAGAGEVSEAALVRDILYVFQGIDGKFIKMSAQDNCYKIDSKVPEPALRLVELFIESSSPHRVSATAQTTRRTAGA